MLAQSTQGIKVEKPFLVLNPVAGTVSAERVRDGFNQACDRYGWLGQVHQTSVDDDLSQIVGEALAQGFDVVMAAGGDGTVSEVASALVSTGTPLAIIPVGTGNVLASELGIPLTLENALAYIGDGANMLRLDAMKVEDRHYVLNVGVGLSSAIMEGTSRQDKRRYGMLAYVWTGMRTLLGLQPYRFHLVVDGKVHTLRAAEILICSGGLLGGFVHIHDVQVKSDDGQLDVFVVKARTLLDFALLGVYLLLGRPRSSQKIVYLQAREHVHIDSRKKVLVEGDGDVIGETPVKLTVIPHAVRVLVPVSRPEDDSLAGRLQTLVQGRFS